MVPPAAALVILAVLAAGAPGGAGAQVPVPPPALPDSLRRTAPVPAPPDTVGEEGPIAAADSLAEGAPAAAPAARPRLRPLVLRHDVLWREFSAASVPVTGVPDLQDADLWDGGERSLTSAPALPAVLDRWGLGWGRVRYAYDGVPLEGPVHALGEPVDLPFAWRGTWRERWSATGTTVDLSAPEYPPGDPLSQISLTTGSLARRTAEFGLFRNLGPVNVGVDFRDRKEDGPYLTQPLNRADQSRVWLRLESAAGLVPDWSADVSSGQDRRRFFDGRELERDVRRAQGSLRGPFLGGATRIALQLRRESLQLNPRASGFGELLVDGFTLQGDWAAPGLRGLTVRARWDRDRRRRLLESGRTFDGFRAGGAWTGQRGRWRYGAEVLAGHQEPYGATWDGQAGAEIGGERWRIRAVASHEEDLPPLVIGVDRATPEAGMTTWLERYETADTPEMRSGVRVEAGWKGERLGATGGGWVTRIRHYRLDSNPLWTPSTGFGVEGAVADRADVAGAYGRLAVEMGRGVSAEGTGRLQSRKALEVPYLARWDGEGSLHWRRPWFKKSMDLDAAVGGMLLGERTNPAGQVYPVSGIAYVRLVGRVDNGIVLLQFQNAADTYLESSLRSDDAVTPVPVAGRTFVLGLTMYLTQ